MARTKNSYCVPSAGSALTSLVARKAAALAIPRKRIVPSKSKKKQADVAIESYAHWDPDDRLIDDDSFQKPGHQYFGQASSSQLIGLNRPNRWASKYGYSTETPRATDQHKSSISVPLDIYSNFEISAVRDEPPSPHDDIARVNQPTHDGGGPASRDTTPIQDQDQDQELKDHVQDRYLSQTDWAGSKVHPRLGNPSLDGFELLLVAAQIRAATPIYAYRPVEFQCGGFAVSAVRGMVSKVL